MSVTPKSGKHAQGDCDSQSPSPLAGSGPGGHKPSFRSTKLARRARSFKEDFLEKISQMRSPTSGSGQGGRPHSPKGSGGRTVIKGVEPDNVDKSPTREVDLMVRQVQVALKHFRDVVSKDKLEMLSGNGTIVLDNVLSILSALKPLINNDQSSMISSATNQVYQSLARLIKLCDDVLLNGNKSSALDQENVSEVVTLLEDAVKNLVKVSQDKIQVNREYKSVPRASYGNASLEMSTQRNSLPDIPLTPRERQILEQTSCVPSLVRSSHSSESILRDNSPPPKPPLPDGMLFSICLSEPDSSSLGTPPPLPPKKRTQRTQQLIGECCNSDSSLLACSFDRVSFRSKSPEDSSSLLSASAGSLDSVLNHSREEEEIRALMDLQMEESRRENDISDITCIIHGTNGNCLCDESFCTGQTLSALNHLPDLQPAMLDANRLSNTDSGFISINSHRNSVQSYSTSKRSSQQSSSSQWSSQQNSFKQLAANSTFSQQSGLVTSESIVQNLSAVQKSESIIQNLSCQAERTRMFESSVQSFSQIEKTHTTTFSSQHSSLSSSQMSDLSVLHSSLLDGNDMVSDNCCRTADENVPPAIPQKTRSRRGRHERQPSPYDNVPLENIGGELIPCSIHQSQSSTSTSTHISTDIEDAKPPPLPIKKKHMFQSVAYSVMAYMEMFGNCSHSNDNEFLRHSVHMVQAQWQNQQSLDSGLTSTQSCSFMQSSSHTIQQHAATLSLTPAEHSMKQILPSPQRSPNSISPNHSLPPALPPKKAAHNCSTKSSSSPPPPPVTPTIIVASSPNQTEHKSSPKLSIEPSRQLSDSRTSPVPPFPVAASQNQSTAASDVNNTKSSDKLETDVPVNTDQDLMEELDVSKYIILKKPDEDGPDIRGGYIDALIVQATKTNKKDFSYQEAFLTTYRTCISPFDLITKLIRRHQYFICQPERKPRARESFSLLVRVVNDLTISDLEEPLVQTIMDFIYQLVSSGNLSAAKPLRVTLIEKYNAKILQCKMLNTQPSLTLMAATAILLEFKSEQIAEQMTLLDANLFMKIEIPEVLIWAQEQNEERSPNLTRFTEHFNKMSYWARTKILQSEAKDREKYVMKFIKIMKHLRKINNFNSYLALLSALDSAPIRRLEWQKHITEGLKEYCALIDSSSSFRAYRQALAETSPPCIPYIGLVLQDLTFVHIGNSNLLQDGTINFSKRWQQFNIVENMKRFKKCSYTFKKNERIIAFFRNFDDFIGEDAMWQISESIKPRGGKKTTQ